MGTVRGTSTRGWSERYQKPWVAWPVAWSAVWVGALTALAAALIMDQREHLCKNLRFRSIRQVKSRKINGLGST